MNHGLFIGHIKIVFKLKMTRSRQGILLPTSGWIFFKCDVNSTKEEIMRKGSKYDYNIQEGITKGLECLIVVIWLQFLPKKKVTPPH